MTLALMTNEGGALLYSHPLRSCDIVQNVLNCKLTGDNFWTSLYVQKYGFDKPNKEALIVTTCKIGGRASRAGSCLGDLGYKNIKVYEGSFTDWKSNNGPIDFF